MRLASMVMIGLALTACSKSNEPSPSPAASVSAAPSARPAASAAPSPSAEAAGSSWSGRYTATPGSFYVPDGGEWSGVKFRGEDASTGLGEGTLALTVDGSGHAQGTLDGPLGPLRLTGELAAHELTAALVSSDPGHGFGGTAVGKEEGDRVTGTMRLSLPTGNVIREAAFSIERKR